MRDKFFLLVMVGISALWLSCGDEEPCSGWHCVDAGPVRSADAGVTADPDVLCSVSEDLVISNTAATVTLGIYSYAPLTARGVIEMAPLLKERMTDKPYIEFRHPVSGELMPADVKNIFTYEQGYSFLVDFYDTTGEIDYGNMRINVSFEIDCDLADASPSSMKTIQSTTYVDWCYWDDYQSESVSVFGWANSGENCIKCDYEECEW